MGMDPRRVSRGRGGDPKAPFGGRLFVCSMLGFLYSMVTAVEGGAGFNTRLALTVHLWRARTDKLRHQVTSKRPSSNVSLAEKHPK